MDGRIQEMNVNCNPSGAQSYINTPVLTVVVNVDMTPSGGRILYNMYFKAL